MASQRSTMNGCPAHRTTTMAPRQAREPNTKTYAGRIAARLRELRTEKRWTVSDICVRFSAIGVPVEEQTWRSYERGKDGGGANLPPNLFPAVAKVFGYDTASGWLPKQ